MLNLLDFFACYRQETVLILSLRFRLNSALIRSKLRQPKGRKLDSVYLKVGRLTNLRHTVSYCYFEAIAIQFEI